MTASSPSPGAAAAMIDTLQALLRTRLRRPDILEKAELTDEDRKILSRIENTEKAIGDADHLE